MDEMITLAERTMNEYITLADQSIVQNAYITKLDTNSIAVYLSDPYSFADICAIFGDKTKTGTMNAYDYGEERTWVGYTEVFAVNIAEGNTYVNLRKA